MPDDKHHDQLNPVGFSMKMKKISHSKSVIII